MPVAYHSSSVEITETSLLRSSCPSVRGFHNITPTEFRTLSLRRSGQPLRSRLWPDGPASNRLFIASRATS